MDNELKTQPENNPPSALPTPFEDAPGTALPILPLNAEDASFDIDAALAAVASLHHLAHDDEENAVDVSSDAASNVEAAPDGTGVLDDGLPDSDIKPILGTGILPAVSPATSAAPPPAFESDFVRPALFVLERGQAASVVPAVLLMASGAWLTYTLVSGARVMPGQLIGLVLAGLGVMCLAQWLSSSRAARGSFFVGWLLIGMGALAMLLSQPGGSGFGVYPLALGVVGAAFLLTALLTTPRSGKLGFVGLAFMAAGLAGLSVTQGLLDAALLSTLTGFAPVIAGLVALVLVAPLLRHQR